MTDASPLVLVVDGEQQMRRLLRVGLEFKGFAVAEAATLQAALEAAVFRSPGVVVLDPGLPDGDGHDFVRKLREWSDIPILILSVRAGESDKVQLLELGADDYMVKPFGMPELVARLRALLRRAIRPAAERPAFHAGDLHVDLAFRRVTVAGRQIRLSPLEFALIRALASEPGRVLTRGQLLKQLWPTAPDVDVQYLRILVKKVRAKIEADPSHPRYLVTELGAGYRMRTEEQLASS